MRRSLTLAPVADLTPLIGAGEVVASSVGPIERGSRCFAIDRGYALFGGGYEERDCYTLFRITPGEKPAQLRKFELRLSGSHAGPVRAVGRGDSIWLMADAKLYRLDIGTALTT